MKRQPNINRRDVADVNKTKAERKDELTGEGPYLFIPEWRDPLPHTYGVLDTNVVFEQGQYSDQWAIIYNNDTNEEKAILKIRKFPNSDLVEFDVELAPIPQKDSQSKDVIVTWKMFNGFNANKTFWSDSNSLEMLQRQIKDYGNLEDTIAGNYYPVTSAIAMRSTSKTGKNV